MAKKILASPKQEGLTKVHQEVTPTTDSDVSNLRSLNRMLVRETFERRKQMETLIQSKGCLEFELYRTNSEKKGLESELTRMVETAAGLEIERAVMITFFGEQLGLKGEVIEQEMNELKRVVGEKENEIERLRGNLSEVECVLGKEMEASKRVSLERDEIKLKLDLQMEVDRRLGSDLAQSEERRGAIERAHEELMADYDVVVGEKGEMEGTIERISGEKDSVERCLLESSVLIKEMKGNVCRAIQEKELMGVEKSTEIVRRQELENDVSRLHDMVIGMQTENEKLRSTVNELEKKCFEGEERQNGMVEENKARIDSMEKQIVLLQNSVEDAHKKKGFWNLFPWKRATTLLVAVSMTFVACRR